jgi:hypothetical protein
MIKGTERFRTYLSNTSVGKLHNLSEYENRSEKLTPMIPNMEISLQMEHFADKPKKIQLMVLHIYSRFPLNSNLDSTS